MAETDREQELLRKIGLLLKKAEGTDNEHEANTFFEGAYNLMAKYAIDEARVRAEQKRTSGGAWVEPVVEDYMFSSYAHHAQAKLTLLEMVAKSQSVKSFAYSNRKDSNMSREGNRGLHESQWTMLIGYKDDIEHVKLLFLSLLIQSQKFAQEDWRRRYGNDKYSSYEDGRLGKFTWMSAHMQGFAERIGTRFRELQEGIYSQVVDANALILDKDANIMEWMYDHGYARRPYVQTVWYCYADEPEENRPFRADGRTKVKNWWPGYCRLQLPAEGVPHEGEHVFSTGSRPYAGRSYYVPSVKRESWEGRSAGRSSADRADIGLTRMGNRPQVKE